MRKIINHIDCISYEYCYLCDDLCRDIFLILCATLIAIMDIIIIITIIIVIIIIAIAIVFIIIIIIIIVINFV